MCLMSYANNKRTDHTAHPCSLISAFVVRCLDSIISSVDTFCRVVAHVFSSIKTSVCLFINSDKLDSLFSLGSAHRGSFMSTHVLLTLYY